MTFQLQQFSLQQDRCAMKVSTDALLLGSWASSQGQALLDVGSGTGILALMLAQRNPSAQIQALEIDPAACQQAQANFLASPWAERLAIAEQPLQHWQVLGAGYDLIICNPPFFKGGQLSADKARNLARHPHQLALLELLQHARRLLNSQNPQARLALVLPLERMPLLLKQASGLGWFLWRRCLTRHSLSHPVKRCLLELGLQPGAEVQEQQLCLREADGHTFSAGYLALTREFHVFGPAARLPCNAC